MEVNTRDGFENEGFSDSVEMSEIIPAPVVGKNEPKPILAVEVRGARKSYGSGKRCFEVLKNFNMAVQENTIYGLLGASGSGKTTILSCIVALKKLDKGNITIYGEPTGTPRSGIPGKVIGYMPQELALNAECTTRETLRFFGHIYGLTQQEFDERYDELMELLSMVEHKWKVVGNMSDGQKRRVSLAVALIHRPKILILDEPTVGCNAILRQSIWKYLELIVSQKKSTVIVTTHYIEETSKADKIGIMRYGRLLAQDSPSNLLEKYNTALLDDIVLTLCEDDESNQKNQNERGIERDAQSNDPSGSESTSPEASKTSSVAGNEEQRSTFALNRLKALLIKNILVLLRNIWFVVFLLFTPSVSVLVFCLAVGSDPVDLKIGVINKEFPGSLCDYDYETDSSCSPANLSCLYLDSLDKSAISLVPYNSEEEAIEDVNLIKLWGLVKFEEDFSKHMFARIASNNSADAGSDATNLGSQIRFKLDMAVPSIGLTLRKLFVDGYRSFSEKLLKSCGIDMSGRDLPVLFETPVFGEIDESLTNFIGPGIGLGFIGLICAITCGISYILEKKDGMFNRTLVAGVTKLEVMIAHLIIQLIICLVQTLIVLVIILLVFNIPCMGSTFLAFFIMILNSIAGIALGFLVATLCDEEKNAMLFAMGAIFPNYILSGLIWPIESLPLVMQYFSLFLPGTLAAHALRCVMSRGFGLEEPAVWIGIISCLIWIAIYWGVIIVFHYRQGRSK